MKNPGMDFEIWKGLRKKWMELDASGHTVKVDFQLIAHPSEPKNIIAIDVIQHIDGTPVTETVQHRAGEAYVALGLSEISGEQLASILQNMMEQLRDQSGLADAAVTLTMTVTSPTSGEVVGMLAQTPIQVGYQHYYLLSALRERMIASRGKSQRRVTARYHAGDLSLDVQ